MTASVLRRHGLHFRVQVKAQRDVAGPCRAGCLGGEAVFAAQIVAARGEEQAAVVGEAEHRQVAVVAGLQPDAAVRLVAPAGNGGAACADAAFGTQLGGIRSEEHTSELQSLMRISYAVFG